MGGALAQLFALDISMNLECVLDRKSAYLRQHSSSRVSGFDYGGGGEGDNFKNSDEKLVCRVAIACYTFGQPRLGNVSFARLFDKVVPHAFRVCVEGDFFCSVPKYSLTNFNSIYVHTKNIVLLDENQNGR